MWQQQQQQQQINNKYIRIYEIYIYIYILENGRGEPYTLRVLLSCCYQTAEENHTH
jgi:hypothetical protein